MTMVEPGSCWDVVPNGIAGDEEFINLLQILDLPMESLEVDGIGPDWDVSKSQCLGPIPSNMLIGPPTNGKIDTGPPYLLPEPVVPITGALKRENNITTPHMIQQDKSADFQESSFSFQTESPISVLESSGRPTRKIPTVHSLNPVSVSEPTRKISTVHSRNPVPVRARSRRVRPSHANPWLLTPPWPATFKRASNPRKNAKNVPEKFESSSMDHADMLMRKNPSPKKCTHCEVTKTPQWREGPLGPKTLCNACGVRYRSGRLFPEYRPAVSPTFVPSRHSNSHKKVIEMRNKGKSEVEETTTSSPLPEFYLIDSIY